MMVFSLLFVHICKHFLESNVVVKILKNQQKNDKNQFEEGDKKKMWVCFKKG